MSRSEATIMQLLGAASPFCDVSRNKQADVIWFFVQRRLMAVLLFDSYQHCKHTISNHIHIALKLDFHFCSYLVFTTALLFSSILIHCILFDCLMLMYCLQNSAIRQALIEAALHMWVWFEQKCDLYGDMVRGQGLTRRWCANLLAHMTLCSFGPKSQLGLMSLWVRQRWTCCVHFNLYSSRHPCWKHRHAVSVTPYRSPFFLQFFWIMCTFWKCNGRAPVLQHCKIFVCWLGLCLIHIPLLKERMVFIPVSKDTDFRIKTCQYQMFWCPVPMVAKVCTGVMCWCTLI